MILLCDTRQQAGKHTLKDEYFRKQGIVVNRTKLYCGDYTLPTNQSICIDTKKDFTELIGDIHTKKMPKKEIRERVVELSKDNHITCEVADKLYHAICDDDYNRFAEKEINDICYENGISESVTAEFQKLYVKRQGFFHRGLIRAKYSDIKLIVLVENEDGVANINDVFHWKNPRMERYNKIKYMHSIGKWKSVSLPKSEPTSGKILFKALNTMQERYGVKFLFCCPEDAGKEVIQLLMKGEDT